MKPPTVEDINVVRLSRFDDAITAALEHERLDFFRQVVGHYVDEHNVPEGDVAAALAIVMQGGQPMLLEPEPERPVREFRERPERDGRQARGDGGADRGRERGERGRAPRGGSYATYRIAVGKRHNVLPRQIVGALANEGGLGREDFGRIDIRGDFSLVELPAELPADAWTRLRGTRISGQLIELSRDDGPRRGGFKR